MERFLDRQAIFLDRLPKLENAIVLLASYYQSGSKTEDPLPLRRGRIARYARGKDYHKVIHKRLKQLEDSIRAHTKGPVSFVRNVDTNPIQERVLAEMAGVGFFGKNTCLILPRGGSFLFLSVLLTNLALIPDEPIQWDCGSCSLCLDACPTQAFIRPYELDARRCISYLTIESKDNIDPHLRTHMGNWIFGCDICQEVCPYNKRPLEGHYEELLPGSGTGEDLPLEKILSCRSDTDFTDQFKGTALMRAKRIGLVRNAAIAAGNLKDPRLVPYLAEALLQDESPVVRQHAAWALGQIKTSESKQLLEKAYLSETQPQTKSEIEEALHPGNV